MNTLLGQILDDSAAAELSSNKPVSEFDSPSEWDLDAEENIVGEVSERPFTACKGVPRFISFPFGINPELFRKIFNEAYEKQFPSIRYQTVCFFECFSKWKSFEFDELLSTKIEPMRLLADQQSS